jgi:N6-L-threonylcarbamoyladenine synthase
MYVLGIETSCDETSAAVIRAPGEILSNEISSSLALHKKYGGVIPEIASRMQLELICGVVDYALKKAKVRRKDIDLISVTSGPGLMGSLVVGISFAKALSLALDIPLLGVNHLDSHIFANFLISRTNQGRKKKSNTIPRLVKSLPFVALVVSGGHTSLMYLRDVGEIEIIGSTLDDACGEAFDKVAKILGLGYPGGPLIERLARKGNPNRLKFNCSNTERPLDFSFSGIKTAVLYAVKAKLLALNEKKDIAASFQEAVCDTLIRKSLLACKLKKADRLFIGGGVVANNRLRERFYAQMLREKIKVNFPAPGLCTDNAAMVAGLGYWLFKKRYLDKGYPRSGWLEKSEAAWINSQTALERL